MTKIANTFHFFKVNKEVLRQLGPFEAILLAYVAEFNDKQLPCFASRKHIAAETGFAEKTVQNLIKKLVKSGHLTLAYSGRKRIICIINEGGTKCPDQGGNKYPQRGHNIPPKGAPDTQIRGHEILNTKIIDTKINNTKINLLSDNFNFDINNTKQEELMTEEERKERERLLRLAKLSSEGWQDKGTYLEKWDEATRTMIRQNKLVHNPQRWNHDS